MQGLASAIFCEPIVLQILIPSFCTPIHYQCHSFNFPVWCKGLFTEANRHGTTPSYLVALKILHDDSSEAKAEMMREAALMAQFHNEHVVNLVGYVCMRDQWQ